MFSNNIFAIEFEGNCQNSLIQNNSFHSNDIGIRMLSGCYGTTIAGNAFFDNRIAVDIEGDCDQSQIANNNVTGGESGIGLKGSYAGVPSSCTISRNNISNVQFGMGISDSVSNNVSENVFEKSGVSMTKSSQNVVLGNIVNGKPLVYLENTSDTVVQDAGQVILVNCNNVTVQNATISYSCIGIELCNTTNSRIVNNSLTGNSYVAVYLEFSDYNTIIENRIEENANAGVEARWSTNNAIISNSIKANENGINLKDYSNHTCITQNNLENNALGINLFYSWNDTIYHNNFVNNTVQAIYSAASKWDDGYRSGGNYWSYSYNGTDFRKGYLQNETGSDGIGDFGYVIDQNNQDNYPLMNSWHEPPWTPYAFFSYSSIEPRINETVTFDAWNSYDFDGQIVNHLWDFGDGTIANETGSLTNHTFTFPRVYNVSLTVVDNEGLNGTAEKSINLIKINSNLSISVSPSAPALGQNTTLSGSVFPKTPQANVPIWVRSGNVWAILANVTTNEDSNYSYVWTPSGMGTYTIKANWTGDNYTFPSESTPLTVTCTRIPTSLSILTNCSSTLDAFKVEVKGTLLDIYSGRLKGETIVLSYTFAGIGIWTPITSDSTDDLGEFRIVWFPPATGNYMLKAEWSGNSTHFGVSSTIAVSTIPYDNQYVFTVESNSTISDLIFDQNSGHLSFGVSGENGTTGYTRVTIAKSLIVDVTKIKILVDGLEYNYTVTELNDSWVLLFTYNHSVHQVEVDLQAAIPEFPSFLMVALFMTGTVLAVVAYKKASRKMENRF
jgi:parallel beta-helix repeat protein